MSQNESTPFLVTDAKNLTLIDATRENSPWWEARNTEENRIFFPLIIYSSIHFSAADIQIK